MRRWLLLFFSFIVAGCGHRIGPAGGSQTEIIVFADREIYHLVQDGLSSTLARELFLPTREEVFTLIPKSSAELSLYNRRRNLLFIGIIGNPLIDNLLSESARRDVVESGGGVFGEKDVYARSQSVCVVTARDKDELIRVVSEKADEIFSFFLSAVKERIEETLYSDGYQKDLAERLLLSYHFSLNLPYGWRIEEHGEKRVIKIYRRFPYRFITIYWEYSPREALNYEEIYDIRDNIFSMLGEEDRVDREMTRLFNVQFQGIEAQKLDGIWENDKHVMGGPFRTYIFSTDHAFYFLDMHLFAPGEKKWFALEQLETIISTWQEG